MVAKKSSSLSKGSLQQYLGTVDQLEMARCQ